ncbi:GNAT family N-acetyltransferase [Streptomyces sp. NPDC053750]|uniref:GNAT family N-acetyltransferase n=1 Tax=Streptomyces sp. NPDC053750 TaxID=3365714 RepID=UPI0037CEED96
MQILSFPEAATPTDLRVQVGEIQEQVWPSESGPDAPVATPTHDPALRPISMLLVGEGTVLAALDILFKEIVHVGRCLSAGGLSRVVTSEQARGRGYGRQLVAAARERMAAQGLDLGLFTCDRPLQPFYGSAGWRVLPGAVLIGGTPQDPFPSDQPGFDKVMMSGFFSAAGRQAQASFHHSRIELYPGEIDKLW